MPYTKQEYCAVMKGMFSLDLSMIGTFSNYNKTGYMNLSETLKKEALEQGATEINDPFMYNQKLIRLNKEVRTQRAVDTVQALKYMSGGAMQTDNMGELHLNLSFWQQQILETIHSPMWLLPKVDLIKQHN